MMAREVARLIRGVPLRLGLPGFALFANFLAWTKSAMAVVVVAYPLVPARNKPASRKHLWSRCRSSLNRPRCNPQSAMPWSNSPFDRRTNPAHNTLGPLRIEFGGLVEVCDGFVELTEC